MEKSWESLESIENPEKEQDKKTAVKAHASMVILESP